MVMPELIFSGPQRLMHNQRALYIKRRLLFEPRVILTAGVPPQLATIRACRLTNPGRS